MRTLLNSLFVLSEDVYLSCKDDNVYVERGKERVGSVPLRSIEHILCFSYKGASPALMGRCAELGVSLSFYSPWGKYYCSIFGENSRNVLLRREQYRIADDESRALPIAKSFVIGKVYNARWVLERARRDHAMSINMERVAGQSHLLADAIVSVRAQTSIDALRGVEGRAAQDYFYTFDDLILRNKDDFFFESRSRRPPMDRMNALLSFVYVLLAGDCAAALHGVGLDPYVGFLHRDLPGRESLALDLMEELRSVLCDRFALSLVNTGAIKSSD
ncbi:CRISPR-associated endonuclease Cas1, partial [Bifidobacterium apri]